VLLTGDDGGGSLTPLWKRGHNNSFVGFWSILISFVVTIANNIINKLGVSAKGHKIVTDLNV
jgi:hypothetical protein